MSVVESRYPVPESGGALARRTAVGVAVAIVVLLVTQGVVDLLGVDLGARGAMTPFAAVPLISVTIVAGVGAAVVYAGLVRFTTRPVRNFVAVATAVFVVMLVPVFLATPSMGVSSVGQALLVLYHLVVAVPLVAFVTGAVRS